MYYICSHKKVAAEYVCPLGFLFNDVSKLFDASFYNYMMSKDVTVYRINMYEKNIEHTGYI